MGFSADWLALREPADHAARDAGLLARAARIARRADVIVDLGCGTGSTRRAFGSAVPAAMQWRMVDGDAALLALAGGEGHCLDLRDLAALPLAGAGLVTASALLDLVSEPWLAGLVARLAAEGLPFYAALSYDGVMEWTPAHDADAAVRAAFNRHQGGDKGFGPALGPQAAVRAAAMLREAGFDVALAESPWRLGAVEDPLSRELIAGIGQAAREVGLDADEVAAWTAARMTGSGGVIGHLDLLALPPGMVFEEGA